MKFKFILLSLFVLLICSGCTVEYNLDIDDALNFDESIAVQVFDADEMGKIRDYNSYLPVDIEADDYSVFQTKKDGVEYYNITKNEDNTELVFDYKYDDVDKFNNNRFANSCYEYVTIMNSYDQDEKRNELILSTSKKFLCFEYQEGLEEVVVKIHTKREVFNHNADSVEGNTYIWNIDEHNKDNASIIMNLSSEIVEKKLAFWERNLLWIFCLIFIIIGGVIYIFMKKRSEKVDKI